MNFTYQPRKIKTRELLAAQGDLAAMIALMAKFAVNDNGEAIAEDVAREALLDMDLEDVVAAQNDFLPVISQLSKSIGR